MQQAPGTQRLQQGIPWGGSAHSHVSVEDEGSILRSNTFFQTPPSVVSCSALLKEELYEMSSGKHSLIKRTWQTTEKHKSVAFTKATAQMTCQQKTCAVVAVAAIHHNFFSCYANKETRSTREQKWENASNKKQSQLKLREGEASKILKQKITMQ